MTSDKPNVFVGGDCGNGGAEIVNAAAEGKWAAVRIHEFLSGEKLSVPLGMAIGQRAGLGYGV